MPTFDRPSYRYYTIAKNEHGELAVRRKDKEGNLYWSDGIEGILTKIDLVEDSYEGKVTWKYHFYFEDPEHSHVDILEVPEWSPEAQDILKTLGSCEGEIGWVSISPYFKKDSEKVYRNVWIKVDGRQVDWLPELLKKIPGLHKVNAGSQQVTDDSRRRAFFRKIAKHVTSKRLAGQPIGHPSAARPSWEGIKKKGVVLPGDAPEPDRPDDWHEIEGDLPF